MYILYIRQADRATGVLYPRLKVFIPVVYRFSLLYAFSYSLGGERQDPVSGSPGLALSPLLQHGSDPQNLRNAYYISSRAIIEKLGSSEVDL